MGIAGAGDGNSGGWGWRGLALGALDGFEVLGGTLQHRRRRTVVLGHRNSTAGKTKTSI